MAKAFSYIRFSTPEQARGDSLRRQLAGAREWCAREGHELDDSLRDLGRSAYKADHAKAGALREFLELVEEERIPPGSFLIVESLDRLSRQAILDAISQMILIVNAGIVIYTLKDMQTYSRERLNADPSAIMFGVIEMYRANSESKWKSVRLRESWQEKRRLAFENGQAMTSICPGWIRLIGDAKTGRYELIPERAAIVTRIFESSRAGQGRRAIVNALNAEQVPTWGEGDKKGERWHDSYVQKILTSGAAIGRFEPLGKQAGGNGSGGIEIEGYYPPAVSEDLYYAGRAASAARRKGEGRPSLGHRNLLRSVAKCGSCGSNLVIVDKGKRSSGPKLICGSAHNSAGCTDRTYHRYHMLETLTLAAVSDRMDALVLSARDRASEIRHQRDAAIAKRAEQQERLDNLIELVAGGAKSSTLAAQVTTLQSEIDAAGTEVARLEVEVRSAEGDSQDAAAGFLELQRQLRDTDGDEHARVRAAVAQRLRGLVDKVVVGHGEATVHLKGGGTGYFAGF